MKYRNIIFDMDGTLTDNKLGIYNSLLYALQQLNYSPLPTKVPSSFIGPPLQKSFKEIYGFNENQTEHAVNLYRVYYAEKGWCENETYDGILELLNSLVDRGCQLFVATSKLEKYARMILDHFEISKYLKDMRGGDQKGTHTKAELIEELMDCYNLDKRDTVMIGDTHYDITGAQSAKIDVIALGYGFGDKNELMQMKPTHFADTVEDLFELFFDLEA